MKTPFLISILFIVVLVLSSCENSERDAGCDINGVWLGHWQIDGGESGTFITPVFQEETHFDGNIFIRFDLPNLENHGVDFSGRIINKGVRSIIEISGVEITVNGEVVNDSSVSGNFEVSLGFSGSYEGEKIALQPIDAVEIYRISNTNNWYNKLISVNNNIWLSDNTGDAIMVINNDGQIVKNIPGNFISYAAAYDGEYFWAYGYDSEYGGENIFKYDTLGNILDNFAVPTLFVDAIAFDGSQIYYADNYNRQVYQINETGTITDSIPALYNSMYSFVFKNHEMLFTSGYSSVLYSMNKEGEIDGAYLLPIEHVQSITTNNNGSFWCLAVEYNMADNGPATSNYIIYRFALE